MAGDFNIDLLKYESNNTYAEVLNTLTSYVFLPHILQPTRITEYSATVIDNIFGNNFVDKTCSGNILIKFADHFSQILCVNKEIIKLKPIAIYRRDYSNLKNYLLMMLVSKTGLLMYLGELMLNLMTLFGGWRIVLIVMLHLRN